MIAHTVDLMELTSLHRTNLERASIASLSDICDDLRTSGSYDPVRRLEWRWNRQFTDWTLTQLPNQDDVKLVLDGGGRGDRYES